LTLGTKKHNLHLSNKTTFINVKSKKVPKSHDDHDNHNEDDEDNDVHEISIIEHKKEDNHKNRSKSIKLDKDLHFPPKRTEESINVRVAYLHALGDFVQSIGVMVAGIIVWIKPELYIVDPICTIGF